MRIRGLRYWLMGFLLIEVAMFILVAKLIGVLLTLLLVFLSSAYGFIMLRNESRSMMEQMTSAMQSQRFDLFQQNANGLKSVAGILMIIPGFITDILGLLLLFGPIRRRLEAKMPGVNPAAARQTGAIEGECIQVDQSLEGVSGEQGTKTAQNDETIDKS